MDSVPILIYACFILHDVCELVECCHQIECNKAGEEKLKNIPDPVYSCSNGEGEFVCSVLTSYINDNLPNHLK